MLQAPSESPSRAPESSALFRFQAIHRAHWRSGLADAGGAEDGRGHLELLDLRLDVAVAIDVDLLLAIRRRGGGAVAVLGLRPLCKFGAAHRKVVSCVCVLIEL